MFVGVLVVQSDAKRACRRWREATQTWHDEIKTVAVEQHIELPRQNTPDMVAAIREGVMEQLRREQSEPPRLVA
jgi:hypothetical protein